MTTSIRIQPGDDRSRTLEEISRLIDIVQASAPGKRVEFAIKPEGRSLDQNALMWTVIRQIGKHLGQPNEEQTKQWLLTECYGERYETIGGRTFQVYPQTKQFTKKQMQLFLAWLEMYADSNGVPLLAPPGYEGFMNDHPPRN